MGTNEILPNVGDGNVRRGRDHVRIELADQVNLVKQAIDVGLESGYGSVLVVLAQAMENLGVFLEAVHVVVALGKRVATDAVQLAGSAVDCPPSVWKAQTLADQLVESVVEGEADRLVRAGKLRNPGHAGDGGPALRSLPAAGQGRDRRAHSQQGLGSGLRGPLRKAQSERAEMVHLIQRNSCGD